jgi:hypothetical protein
MKSFVQQYGKKISLLSQQTGKDGKKKVKPRKIRTRQNTKKNKYR